MSKTWKIVGVSFDHVHMGELLREAHRYSNVQIAGICDWNPANAESVQWAVKEFGLTPERVFSDVDKCLEATRPDLVILCPSTGSHADVVERVAPHGVNMVVEKPFAASLADADRMIEAARAGGSRLFINWPTAWHLAHLTTKRLIDEGVIGDVLEIHYFDGNRGPVRLMAGSGESEEEAFKRVSASWLYRKAEGGGALLDYLGYGVTLGTWFVNKRKPIDVTCTTWSRPGAEVDEHALCAVRYEQGLSKFETQWGTFTNPWETQPQPKCGFVICGSRGTISSYDNEKVVSVQTCAAPEIRQMPVDAPIPGRRAPIEHLLDVLENGSPVHEPLTVEICRIGQQIVDTALASAREGRTVKLLEK